LKGNGNLHIFKLLDPMFITQKSKHPKHDTEKTHPALIPSCFSSLEADASSLPIPESFAFIHHNKPHPLAELAVKQLQSYLIDQTDFIHNFGLLAGQKGAVIGKMFGVLVVKNSDGTIGFLSAFSGKLAGGNNHVRFVPPVYDSLADDGFLIPGMAELKAFTDKIKSLEIQPSAGNKKHAVILKAQRKALSISLQQQLFDNYHFLNSSGISKSLIDIFKDAGLINPPSGAGECAGPKLFQYAFGNSMQPLAIAEFWWGQSPKSATWKHGHFYACCKEKCEPVFAHMLGNFG